MPAAEKLTDTKIRALKPSTKQYRVSDGRGLSLLIHPNGSKYWRQRYRRPGTGGQVDLALGVYPAVTLKAARQRSHDLRRELDKGIDPGYRRRAHKEANADTFSAIAQEWLESRRSGWSDEYEKSVTGRINGHLLPWLGNYPIGEIEAPELLATLRRTEAKGAVDTAHRLRGYCDQVFRYAIATGRARRNPAADLKGTLSTPQKQHIPAITNPDEVGALLRAMQGYRGEYPTQCALWLSAYTFSRPGPLRNAKWADIDFDSNEWRYTEKGNHPHLVPLCRQVQRTLSDLYPLTSRRSEYVFPSLRSNQRPMSENTVSSALRRVGYTGAEMNPHGFRAMARTLLDEQLGYRIEVIEMQLAHTVRDVHGRAYNRTQFIEQRREMMQKWADYLDHLRDSRHAK